MAQGRVTRRTSGRNRAEGSEAGHPPRGFYAVGAGVPPPRHCLADDGNASAVRDSPSQ